jgi:hypothetical protein
VSAVAASFRFRRFLTAGLSLSFLVAAVSGIVLFLRPEGSLARWTGWAVMGLDKRRWEAVHIVFVLVLLVASLAHVWLNRRPLVTSVLGGASTRPAGGWRASLAREFVAALGLVVLAFSAATTPWQPAAALNGLRSLLKDGTFAAKVLPPVVDADKLTVRELCKVGSLDEQRAVAQARRRGIEIRDPSQTVAAIAQAHHVTPEAVYVALRGD